MRAGEALVINRYTESNLAYGSANGLDISWLANIEKGMPRADLVVVLYASPDTLEARRPGRRKDAYERNSLLQAKAQQAYRELAQRRGWRLVDAGRPVSEVHKTIVGAVKDAMRRDRGFLVRP